MSKKIPKFKNEKEEIKFWNENSPLDFPGELKETKLDFPNLKPTSQSMTIRVNKDLIDNLKLIANKKRVPYQSLVKVWLAEKVKEEQQIDAK